jgi:hypothetical protein
MEHDSNLVIIYTKFIAPSNVLGSRIGASVANFTRKKATVPANHALGSMERHLEAAWELLDRNNQKGLLRLLGYDSNPGGSGYAFVFQYIN